MSKAFFLLLITFLISQYNGLDCSDDQTPTKAEDCNGREKGNDVYRCCFLEAGEAIKNCEPVTKEGYDKIADVVEELKKQYGVDVSIDCGANYIIVSLISLILLFL